MHLGIFVAALAMSSAQQYITVPSSSRYYGQDGPWGAVTVSYGGYSQEDADDSRWQPFDFFPGGQFNSFIISPQAYGDNGTHLCGLAGTTSTPTTQTLDGSKIWYRPEFNYTADSGIYMIGNIYTQTMHIGTFGGSAGQTVFNTSTVIVDGLTYLTPANKNITAVEIGFLALGDGDKSGGSTAASNNSDHGDIQAWNIPRSLWSSKVIPSFTYSLHLGSAALRYPISLIFGGYDKGRMIGAPTTFSGQATLLDIGIGVELGASPFNFSSKSGLLFDASGHNAAITADPDPQGPYLSLPEETCTAITENLPVKFNDSSGYYLWQVDDPAYSSIVSSPAFLSFTFPPSPGDTENVTVKVPFLLLNLTLGPALSGLNEPVPYFPCMPYVPTRAEDHYVLGRAFLQAALIGRNWDKAVSWLAQAPGPGLGLQGLGVSPQNIDPDQVTLEAFPGDAAAQSRSTWSAYWTPLPEPIASNDSATAAPDSDGDLSTGAKAGIGVGVSIIGTAFIAGLVLILWRRKKASSAAQTMLLQDADHKDSILDRKDPSPPYPTDKSSVNDSDIVSPAQTDHFEAFLGPAELYSHHEPQELSDTSPH